MTNHKYNPAEIYLVPMLGDEHDHIWCEDPAPGEGMREEDATRYVREDLVPASNAVLANSIAELTRKNSDLAAQVSTLNKLIVGMQERACLFLTPRGESDESFINFIIGELDGPEQRLAQSTPSQCLAERDEEVVGKAFMAGYKHGSNWHSVYTREEARDLYLKQLRQLAKAGAA